MDALKKLLVVAIALGGGLWVVAYVAFFCLYFVAVAIQWMASALAS